MTEVRAIKRLLKSLDTIKTQVSVFTEQTDISEIKTNLSILADEWKEFQALEKTLKGKFDDANLEAVEKIENSHFDLKQKLVRWEKIHEQNNDQYQERNITMEELMLNQSNFIQEMSSINKRDSEVRLPRVNIPSFSGNYSEFPSFRDLFETSIHNKNNISKVHKLQYLKGLLKGEAYALINNITVTEANYDEAWGKIKARYDKKRHVVNTLVKQFMDQPVLTQSCAKSLRLLSDVSDEVIRGLKVLGEQAESRDPWLIHILINKLDSDSKEAWAHETAKTEFPTLTELFSFLNERSDALESLNSMQKPKPTTTRRVNLLLSQRVAAGCPLCSAAHYLGRCEKFLKLPIHDRKQLAVDKKLCFNCLSSTHQSTVCRSRYSCRICKRKHHISLHTESTTDDSVHNRGDDESDVIAARSSTNCNAIMKSRHPLIEPQGILPTAIVLVADKFGKQHRCRVLLDSGSQCSFVSENCMQRLQIKRQRANVNITGIASGSVISRGKACILMRSLYDSNVVIEVNALIINQLPSRLPTYKIAVSDRCIFEKIELADPNFDEPAPIDILIGADKFFAILESQQRHLNSITMQKTVFGWIVSGQSKSIPAGVSASYMALNIQIDMDIDQTLRRFWEIDEMLNVNPLSPDDTECEEFYDKTHRRQQDGRYIVKLPFKKSSQELGNSVNVATRRFMALERKLSSDAALREQYVQQVREYIDMGHAVEIPQKEFYLNDSCMFYLPHHSVIKETSSTTKVRVVFDGSSKTSTGISLNSKLMVGPTLQPTLWTTLMKFRCHRIAITADVEKMYRQVLVASEDTDYQRILWREKPNDKLRHYKLNRVTFGLACSAYLAIRTLQQLARDVGNENVTQNILSDFYVDDLLSGSPDIQGAARLKNDITNVLKQGGFQLRKWQSNVQSLCDEVHTENTTNLCSEINISNVTILGLHWHPDNDMLTFKVSPEKDSVITKRKVISEASRVFDPLGFLSPSIVMLKILFQHLWFLKLDWDDKLPDYYERAYTNVREEFIYFQDVKIQRFTNHYQSIQIHGFADASEVAYCAVVYSRTVSENGEIIINFLTSKTKVAPVKKISLPRLELCAAHLLAKLMYTVKETVAPQSVCYAWTDSSIVLAWLSTYPARWKTFVSNRTSQILEKFPRQHWAHVNSTDNPADHGSRGVSPQKLIKLQQWWNGPCWLKLPESSWPTQSSNSTSDEVAIEAETRKSNLPTYALQATVQNCWLDNIFKRSSRLLKVFRVVAYVKRYISNSRLSNASLRNTSELKANEVEDARITCLIWVQNSEYNDDISNLKRNKTVSNNSKLISLAPFIDAIGVLRVGGRLFNSDSDYDNKHPAILPSNHVFTERLIWETHRKNLHAGPTLSNNLIRQKYWIVKGRSRIKSLLKNCVTCAKYARKTSSQLMGNLPIERIIPTRPFTNCGIDFAGPLYFATKKGRGGTNPRKGYLCIFVCLSVKAIHIEPVSDLTTDAFLAALRRFTARRGVPKKIYTDNGTNFIGARRILNDAYKLIRDINQNYIISEYLSENRIDWHFIPPASPHFGGLWESAVKSVKTHLFKSVSNVNLTFEEMATLLCQIESILNSRPLCTTSTDDDYEVLTPAHFLIVTSMGSIPEKQITSADSTLSRWQRIQARTQTFWKKYYLDYVNNLQQRHKWQKSMPSIEVGDIVLIKEDNVPVCKWPLGRVLQTHPGEDNLVRVATIKTINSTLKRPIIKLCKLPVG